MNVEYTGRHYEVTSAIRHEVENRLTKIRKILGDKFDTKVILAVEKSKVKPLWPGQYMPDNLVIRFKENP